MSKEDLVNKLKEECNFIGLETTKSILSKFIDLFEKVTIDVLSTTEGQIRLPKIGKLYTVVSKEKQCRNPQTGETMTVPEKRRVKFKMSQTLLDTLNEN